MVFYLPFYVTPTLIVPERAITANIPFVNVILIAADLATTVSVVDDINLAGTFVFAIYLFLILVWSDRYLPTIVCVFPKLQLVLFLLM